MFLFKQEIEDLLKDWIFVKISGSLCLNLSLSCEKNNKNKKPKKNPLL